MIFCIHPSSRFFSSVVFAFALSFFLAGCASEPKLEREPTVILGPNGKPLPLMEAKGAFFGGTLLAEIRLSQSRGRGGFHPAPVHGLPMAGSDVDSGEDVKMTQDMADEIRARRAESPLPPINLWLKLTSAASNPLNVEIVDFNSDLGNFAVQPEQLALAPGQSVEAEPMISRLGVTSLEIPVTVTLRLDGKAETQVVTLRPVENAATPPAKP
jgi:hypothetical protein